MSPFGRGNINLVFFLGEGVGVGVESDSDELGDEERSGCFVRFRSFGDGGGDLLSDTELVCLRVDGDCDTSLGSSWQWLCLC